MLALRVRRQHTSTLVRKDSRAIIWDACRAARPLQICNSRRAHGEGCGAPSAARRAPPLRCATDGIILQGPKPPSTLLGAAIGLGAAHRGRRPCDSDQVNRGPRRSAGAFTGPGRHTRLSFRPGEPPAAGTGHAADPRTPPGVRPLASDPGIACTASWAPGGPGNWQRSFPFTQGASLSV